MARMGSAIQTMRVRMSAASLHVMRRPRRVALALVLLLCAVLPRWLPKPALSEAFPTSRSVMAADGRLLRLTLASDEQYRLRTPLQDMAPAMREAVLLYEDRWFYWHCGVNPWALLRASAATAAGTRRIGGSTITMQLARSLWQLNTRTPQGKIRQVARALELELFYSKRQILEAYLNDVSYGRNIEGAGAASLVYFNQAVATLSLPEALTLAVIPQDPARRLRTLPQDAARHGQRILNPSLTAARDRLYARWLKIHPEDRAAQALFALPLTIRPLASLPFQAPHAVEQVLAARRAEGDGASAKQASVVTTIDLSLQHVLERQLQAYVVRNGTRGIHNAAAILVDTRDMGIKALVGSADYFDRTIQGQVNGTLARRSPGSTLKPFIYGLGFDQGVLHPQTVLRDVPTSFGPYAPENFDGDFLGPITATDALNRSRNIPAVWVASQLHQPDLYQFLQSAGIGHLASEQHYGLALVLGGGEVTMQELADLYAMLANRGVLKPLRLQADTPQTPGTRLLSREASFMVQDMLRQHIRPDETSGAQPARLPVYWKTGTSWAFRDAWTAGSFGPYVLVVWVGNFDSTGNPALVGVEAAAPLFFQIVDDLEAERPQLQEPPRPMPHNLKRVQICLASGDLPNQWCPQRGWTWFIPGKSPIRVSTVHRPVVIDNATGLPACPPYDSRHTHQEIYEFWPSDLQQVFARAGIARRTPPQNLACRNAGEPDGAAPQITSPLRGSSYAIRLKQSGTQIALTATTDADAHALYWFANDMYLGRATPGQALYWQPVAAGSYRIRTIDDHGRGDQRAVEVRLLD